MDVANTVAVMDAVVADLGGFDVLVTLAGGSLGTPKDLAEIEDPAERRVLEQRVVVQRRRSQIILRASQLLYVAISCFVGTSLLVAGDSFFNHVFGPGPTIMAVLGVLAMFGSSLLLASEASMAVRAINDEMDDRHRFANRLGTPPQA